MSSRFADPKPQSDRAPTVLRETGAFRKTAEALIYLALAVILFRGFVAEGYMISTGSMAPCLLGYHRQVVCPSCSYAFSRGMHHPDEDSILAFGHSMSGLDLGSAVTSPATACPNCGLRAIDIRTIPRNEGDQLLVQKHLYQLRPPRRWEVVVFRHPTDPDQAYVKRVVGLPGETVELIDGDVYADGELQRKTLSVQQGMRITVYDQDHEPTDRSWRPRWRSDNGHSRWQRAGSGFVHHSAGDPAVDWLTYHHWIRDGGWHRTTVKLAHWPADAEDAASLDPRLHVAADRSALECDGVLSPRTAERLRKASNDQQWIAAVRRLEAASHEGVIVDSYGYNRPKSSDPPRPVHDLMLEVVFARAVGSGDVRIRMTDGWHWFETVFDLSDREVRLHVDDEPRPIRSAALPIDAFAEESTVTCSLFDRQVLTCLNGKRLMEPLAYAAEHRPRRLTSRPVQIGVADLELFVSHLRLYRDVFYTPKHGIQQTPSSPLGPAEYFVLGDNSPVSVDSRSWPTPAIPRDLLVGKPFLVHLPSQQGRVEFAGKSHHIRIPDFSRVRYIR